MLHFLEVAGVMVFAFSGALEGARKRMDLFGVLVVALVTALGGGTLRDLMLATLKARPIFWMEDSAYIYLALAGGLLGFWFSVSGHFAHRTLLLADAVGLSVASVIGAQKALAAGATAPVVLIMAVMTGVAGSIGRDILCNEVPIVFRPDTRLYATAALFGGALFLVLRITAATPDFATGCSILATLALRLAALRWKLMLPVKRAI
jgi:uncharacterized membrane protein YeiH